MARPSNVEVLLPSKGQGELQPLEWLLVVVLEVGGWYKEKIIRSETQKILEGFLNSFLLLNDNFLIMSAYDILKVSV